MNAIIRFLMCQQQDSLEELFPILQAYFCRSILFFTERNKTTLDWRVSSVYQSKQ